ncbi:MAG: hypothetical protein JSU91_03505 [Thermoplasmatales archaeon]|nr:MAG: hypothetical protein JSU91_03505 [Thermoplasmatales archaeon]
MGKISIFKKGFVLAILILIVSLNVIPSIEGGRQERSFYNSDIDGIYYLRDDDPLDWADIGSLLMGMPVENELTRCGMFVNFHLDQKGKYSGEYEIYNIYYHFWQRAFEFGEYEIGYSTSSNHTAGFNESIWVDINEYITEVNEYRLIQVVQDVNPQIAKFFNDEVYDFTIKFFGPNPNILCNPNQYSFVILNLEDNITLQKYDRDNDLITDYEELFVYYTNPFDIDTDNDGSSDYLEVSNGADPNDFNDSLEVNEPNIPTIKGPTVGKKGIKYDYKFSSNDPQNDDVFYYVIWGDEQNGKWIGSYSSGEEVTFSHIWDKNGEYTIMAKARDTSGAESDWGNFDITIPRSRSIYHSLFLRLLEQYPILERLFYFIN